MEPPSHALGCAVRICRTYSLCILLPADRRGAAAASRTSLKHDWYVWNDGIAGSGPKSHEGRVPPNNWVSVYGGSAWEWVPSVHRYYYHRCGTLMGSAPCAQ